MALHVTLLGWLVVLEQSVVLLRLHDPLPVDVLRKAEVVVLQNGHAAGADFPQ